MFHVSFLYFEDCPSYEPALERLRQVIAEEGIAAEVEIIKVETDMQAEHLHFAGSPTILVEGRDIDPPPADLQFALTCRVYRREDGRISPLPSPELIRRSLRAAVARAAVGRLSASDRCDRSECCERSQSYEQSEDRRQGDRL